MAAVIAVRLRGMARELVTACGGRGFVRFCPAGDALLATDAYGRCADEEVKTAMRDVLSGAGFCCQEQGNLLMITPGDVLLESLLKTDPLCPVDWDSPLHPVQSLADRWAKAPVAPLTEMGRRLVMHTLRAAWQGDKQLLSELSALRAHAAVMLREGDRSGMRMAAAVLQDFCMKNGEA